MDSTDAAPTTSPDQPPSALANHAHLRQKRARSQLSCTPCRQGKLKCNRERDPACDQCIKRNRDSVCFYVPPPVKNKPSQNVKGRIRQLEALVVDLMNQQNRQSADRKSSETQDSSDGRRSASDGNSESPVSTRKSRGSESQQPGPISQLTPPSDNDTSPQWSEEPTTGRSTDSPDAGADSMTKPFGAMKISKDEISYVGEAHWQAILNGISDLKRDLADEGVDDDEGEAWDSKADEDPPEQTLNSWGSIPMGGAQPQATTGLGFMLGNSQSVTKDQLIKAMPEKKVADRLLSLWFNSPDPFKPIIHAPTFQDEYRRFWRSPQTTPVMWLGLLYAILSLAESFGLRDNDPSSAATQACLQRVNKYHSLAASAAVSADFTKPKPYTLECLILYSAGLRSNNAFVNVWLMIGLVVRLGLRMGYHRDASAYPNISPFQGEMRRRVWAVINMIDVLISFQLGLPSIVRTINSDTKPPRNLLDRDFNVNSKVLPESRGVNELTPASYTRAKTSIVRIFAQAAELSHLTITPPADEVARLDRELEDARAAIPPLLQMPDISELVTDPAEQLMCRVNLDLLYLKTKTVLHRRYMLTPLVQLSPEEQARGIGVSRKHCIECALRVLQHHHTIYQASQPGGQLESVKWYMGSISTHDFLLAAMVICLELSTQINDTEGVPQRQMCPRRQAMMDVLEQSQRIWEETSNRNRKAREQAGGTRGLQVSSAGAQAKSGNGWKSGGSHMFDETDKASKAMAVMIERVKTNFPSTKFQNLGPAKGPIDFGEIPNGALGEGRSIIGDASETQNAYSSEENGTGYGYYTDADLMYGDMLNRGGQVSFVSPFDASNPFTNAGPNNGISANPVDFGEDPESYSAASTGNTDGGVAVPSAVSNASPSQPDAPTQQPPQPQQDFSMIGNMLDLPMNLDWEDFDSTTLGAANARSHPYVPNAAETEQVANQQQQQQQQNRQTQQGIIPSDYVLFGAFPRRDEAMLAQFDQFNGAPVPEIPYGGNVAFRHGTGPGVSDFSKSDWNVDAMQDLDFDASNLMSFETSGAWPGQGNSASWRTGQS